MSQNTPPKHHCNNINTANSYSNKVRGTHARVNRVKVTTVGKTAYPEKQHRSCPRCKESTSSMKLLTARIGRIEQLVEELAKTTRGLASMSKREDRTLNMKFKGIDLTRYTLEELQKLVVATTNIMTPSSRNNKVDSKPPITPPALTDITITTNNEKKIYAEPMEDIKMFDSNDSSHDDSNNHSQQQSSLPVKTPVNNLKHEATSRQDSACFCD